MSNFLSRSFATALSLVALLAAVPAASQTSGRCQTNMAFMASKFQNVGNSDVQAVIDAALATDVVDTMRKAKAAGYSSDTAIDALISQAKADDSAAREALSTASQTDALGNTDEQFFEVLKSGTLLNPTCDGIRNAALCAAAINKVGAVTNRAVAAEIRCHARAGSWPS